MAEREKEIQNQIDTMKEIRKKAGLNRREFSEYMGIPIRTLEEWEAGRRKMPDYVLRLIVYKIETEEYFKEKGIQKMKKDENLCLVREVLNSPAVELFQTSKNMHKFCYIDSPDKLTFWKYSTSNEDFFPSCCEE